MCLCNREGVEVGVAGERKCKMCVCNRGDQGSVVTHIIVLHTHAHQHFTPCNNRQILCLLIWKNLHFKQDEEIQADEREKGKRKMIEKESGCLYRSKITFSSLSVLFQRSFSSLSSLHIYDIRVFLYRLCQARPAGIRQQEGKAEQTAGNSLFVVEETRMY